MALGSGTLPRERPPSSAKRIDSTRSRVEIVPNEINRLAAMFGRCPAVPRRRAATGEISQVSTRGGAPGSTKRRDLRPAWAPVREPERREFAAPRVRKPGRSLARQ